MSAKTTKYDFDKEMKQAFKVFDCDDSGTISTAELRLVMNSIGQKLTDEQIDELMKEVDQNGDGTIDCKFAQPCTERSYSLTES